MNITFEQITQNIPFNFNKIKFLISGNKQKNLVVALVIFSSALFFYVVAKKIIRVKVVQPAAHGGKDDQERRITETSLLCMNLPKQDLACKKNEITNKGLKNSSSNERDCIVPMTSEELTAKTVEQEIPSIGSTKLKKPEVTAEQLKYFTELFKTSKIFCLYGEEYLALHGKTLCQAQVMSESLNQQGIPTLFTAQTLETIFFQILMKKIHEKKFGDLGKHRKILRTDYTATVSNIKEARWSDSHADYSSLLCASMNIFHCTHSESMNFFLNKGESNGAFRLFQSIEIELNNYELTKGEKDKILVRMNDIVSKYSEQLPARLLEMLVLDMEDISPYFRVSAPYGYRPSVDEYSIPQIGENSKEYLLKMNLLREIDKINAKLPEARVLAPRPNVKQVRTIRLINEKDEAAFKNVKKEIQEMIDQVIDV